MVTQSVTSDSTKLLQIEQMIKQEIETCQNNEGLILIALTLIFVQRRNQSNPQDLAVVRCSGTLFNCTVTRMMLSHPVKAGASDV